MARRAKTKGKKFEQFKCPKRLPKGKKGGRPEPCWRTEKVTRFGRSGYVTTFYDRSTGRFLGYGKGYLTSGKNIQKICGVSRDPFRAIIKHRSTVAMVGELCIRMAEAPKRKKPKAKRKARAKRRKRA